MIRLLQCSGYGEDCFGEREDEKRGVGKVVSCTSRIGENVVVFASQHPFFLLLVTAFSLVLGNQVWAQDNRVYDLKDLTGKKHKNRPRLAEVSNY